MTKEETSIIDNSTKQNSVDTPVSSMHDCISQECDKNMRLSSDETNYGRFHVVAVTIIVLIFLLKLSSTSTPIEPNHERLSSQTTETVNNAIAIQK